MHSASCPDNFLLNSQTYGAIWIQVACENHVEKSYSVGFPHVFPYTKGRSSAFHKPICGEVCRSAVASTVLWTGGTMQEASLIPLGPQNLRMHVNVTNAKKIPWIGTCSSLLAFFDIPYTLLCVCVHASDLPAEMMEKYAAAAGNHSKKSWPHKPTPAFDAMLW